CLGKKCEEIAAMHAEGRIPAGGIRDLHGGDGRPVMAKIRRAGADPRAVALHRRLKTDPLQLPHAVRGEKHAGADFAERGSLLVDGYVEAVGEQRVGREQAADTSTDDNNRKPHLFGSALSPQHAHRFRPQKSFPTFVRSSYPFRLVTPSCGTNTSEMAPVEESRCDDAFRR